MLSVWRPQLETRQALTPEEVQLGDKVELTQNRVGEVRWIGVPSFAHDQVYVGIDLEKGEGKNDGKVGNMRYFKCPKNRGLFVPFDSVVKMLSKGVRSRRASVSSISSPRRYPTPRRRRQSESAQHESSKTFQAQFNHDTNTLDEETAATAIERRGAVPDDPTADPPPIEEEEPVVGGEKPTMKTTLSLGHIRTPSETKGSEPLDDVEAGAPVRKESRRRGSEAKPLDDVEAGAPVRQERKRKSSRVGAEIRPPDNLPPLADSHLSPRQRRARQPSAEIVHSPKLRDRPGGRKPSAEIVHPPPSPRRRRQPSAEIVTAAEDRQRRQPSAEMLVPAESTVGMPPSPRRPMSPRQASAPMSPHRRPASPVPRPMSPRKASAPVNGARSPISPRTRDARRMSDPDREPSPLEDEDLISPKKTQHKLSGPQRSSSRQGRGSSGSLSGKVATRSHRRVGTGAPLLTSDGTPVAAGGGRSSRPGSRTGSKHGPLDIKLKPKDLRNRPQLGNHPSMDILKKANQDNSGRRSSESAMKKKRQDSRFGSRTAPSIITHDNRKRDTGEEKEPTPSSRSRRKKSSRFSRPPSVSSPLRPEEVGATSPAGKPKTRQPSSGVSSDLLDEPTRIVQKLKGRGNSELRTGLKTVEKLVKTLKVERKSLKDRIAELEKENEKLKIDKNILKVEKTTQAARVRELTEQRAELYKNADALERRLTGHEEEIEAKDKVLNNMEGRLDRAMEEIKSMSGSLQQREFDLENVRISLNERTSQLEKMSSTPTRHHPRNPTDRMLNRLGPAFQRKTLIGMGRFGEVYKILNTETQEIFAQKVIKKRHLSEAVAAQQFHSELKVLMRCKHNNIIEMIRKDETSEAYLITMELCELGSARDFFKDKIPLSEDHTRFLMGQVLQGLDYLHSRGVIHRDLKLGNLLMVSPFHVKLADFGLSKIFDVTYSSKPKTFRTNTFVGTQYMRAPELLMKQAIGYSFKVDLWAVGIMTWQFLIGGMPFLLRSQSQIKRVARKLKIPQKVNEDACDFIESVLEANEEKRFTTLQALTHRWIFNPPSLYKLKQDYQHPYTSPATTPRAHPNENDFCFEDSLEYRNDAGMEVPNPSPRSNKTGPPPGQRNWPPPGPIPQSALRSNDDLSLTHASNSYHLLPLPGPTERRNAPNVSSPTMIGTYNFPEPVKGTSMPPLELGKNQGRRAARGDKRHSTPVSSKSRPVTNRIDLPNPSPSPDRPRDPRDSATAPMSPTPLPRDRGSKRRASNQAGPSRSSEQFRKEGPTETRQQFPPEQKSEISGPPSSEKVNKLPALDRLTDSGRVTPDSGRRWSVADEGFLTVSQTQ